MRNKSKRRGMVQKSFIVVSSAAVLAISGGIGVPAPSASAASAAETYWEGEGSQARSEVVSSENDFIASVVHRQLQSIVFRAASESDLQFGDVLTSVQDGSSLADATGVGVEDLRGALHGAYANNLELERKMGKLTPKQMERALRLGYDLIDQGIVGSWNEAISTLVPQVSGEELVSLRMSSIVRDAATWAGGTTEQVRIGLRQGKNLLQAATPVPSDSSNNDDEDDENDDLYERYTLPEYLELLLKQELDEGVKEGKISSEEAGALFEDGAVEISRILGTSGYEPEPTAWQQRYGEKLMEDLLVSVQSDTAMVSDEEYDDVLEAIDGGSTLAKAADMSEDELSDALTTRAEDKIEKAWSQGAITSAQAEEMKKEAEERLNAIVRGTASESASPVKDEGNSVVAEASLRGIIEHSAIFGEDMTADDLRDALKDGRTIVQAIDEEDNEALRKSLQWHANRYIDEQVTAGLLDAAEAESTKALAGELIDNALHTPGFTPKVNVEHFVHERLANFLSDAAGLAVLPEEEAIGGEELLKLLAQGHSLSATLKLSDEELVYQLASEVNRQLAVWEAYGFVTEQQCEEALESYMSGLHGILHPEVKDNTGE